MTDQPTPRPDVPMELLMIAQAAFSGRKPMADGTFVLPSNRNPWAALHDALAAVLPAHERQVMTKLFGTPEEVAAREAEARERTPDDTVRLCEMARPGEHERRVREQVAAEILAARGPDERFPSGWASHMDQEHAALVARRETAQAEEWRCPRCGSPRWVAASLTGPVEYGGRAIKQCIPCGHYSNDDVRGKAR